MNLPIDISHARGLTHLRNALLEDRSFDWPATTNNAKSGQTLRTGY